MKQPPSQSLREAADDLLATSQSMRDSVYATADMIEQHLAKVARFKDVVTQTWDTEINGKEKEHTPITPVTDA